MKRIYLLSLWLLACLVLPMTGQAVSQAELLNSEHYQHIDSTVDSGRGDGKYLDLSSIKAVDAPDGHRRVEATIYVLMPASNLIQGIHLQYDYDLERSLRRLVTIHEKGLQQGTNTPYISIWRAKQENPGIIGTVNGGVAFNNEGRTRQQRLQKEHLEAMILPPQFGMERYTIANIIYQKAFGVAYDDEP